MTDVKRSDDRLLRDNRLGERFTSFCGHCTAYVMTRRHTGADTQTETYTYSIANIYLCCLPICVGIHCRLNFPAEIAATGESKETIRTLCWQENRI